MAGEAAVTYQSPYLCAHQSRTHAPTDWEFALADALEAIFSGGAQQLDEVVSGLNASRVRPRHGGQWTAETFTAAMHELGA
jgi:hypothetical protein